MLDLNELQQLVDFADLGTLSKVAEKGQSPPRPSPAA